MRADTAIFTAFEDFDIYDKALPERNLMRAILRSVMDDIKKSGEPYREAKKYILSDDDTYVFSFVSVCHHLGLCPRTIRRIVGIMRGEDGDSLAA